MSLLKTYLTEYPWSLRLEIADWKKHGERLAFIEKSCFEEQMRSQAYDLKGLIEDESSLAMVLYDGEEMAGYIAGVPLESSSSSFDQASDPKEGWGELDTMYIDNVSILPAHRNQNNLRFLLAEFIRHSKDAGYLRATTHARKSNGLSAYCIRKFKFKRLKTINNWYDCGEDFDYIVIPKEELAKHETLPSWHKLMESFRTKFSDSMIERYFRKK